MLSTTELIRDAKYVRGKKDHSGALALLKKAFELAEKEHDYSTMAEVKLQSGLLHNQIGELDIATRQFNDALSYASLAYPCDRDKMDRALKHLKICAELKEEQ